MDAGTVGRLALALTLACGSSARRAPPVGPDGGATCEPGRCLDDISHHVQQHRKAARGCYDKGLERQAGVGGLVIVNFEIGPDGRVVEAAQGMQPGQLAEQDVIDCIVTVVKQIQFPASAAGKTTKAYHRFEFSAR